MTERIVLLLAVAFACVYGIKQLLNGFKRKYFIVVLCGMAALFLSRIYYLVIVLSSGNDGILTVGVLGQASAYLFFITANTSFLSRGISAKIKRKICIPGTAGAVAIAVLFILSAVKIGTLSAYIGELIYVLSMCCAFYVSANVVAYRREDAASSAACKFNICVCILAALNAFSEFAAAAAPETTTAIINIVLSVMCSLTVIAMLPVLKKGMKKWTQ